MQASCRLPFTTFTATGFISDQDGTFTPDATAATEADPTRPGFVRTVVSPALYSADGTGGTYDWSFSRWLPVASGLESPDGSQYTYSEVIPNPASQGSGGPPPPGTRVHVVDVATGKDTIVYQSTNVLSAIAFKREGIYLTEPAFLADTVVPFYVWLLDPFAGSAHRVLGGKSVGPGSSAFAAGTLWLMATDPSNPKAAPTLLRISISDGSQAIWFEPTMAFAQIVGLDRLDRPIVSTFSSTNGDPGKTWLVSGAGSLQPIADEGFTGAVSDSHGTWLSGNGVFLDPNTGPPVQKVSTASGAVLGSCG